MLTISQKLTYWLAVCLASLIAPSFLAWFYGALFGPDFLGRFYFVAGGLCLLMVWCAGRLPDPRTNTHSTLKSLRPLVGVFRAGGVAIGIVALLSFLTWHYACWIDGNPTPVDHPVFHQPPPYYLSGASGPTEVSHLRYLIARTSPYITFVSLGLLIGLGSLYDLLYYGRIRSIRKRRKRDEKVQGTRSGENV